MDLRYRRTDADESSAVEAVTRNIGIGGAYILTDEPEKVGANLLLELRVPGADEPIVVRADVRWIAPAADDQDTAGMGVRFIDLDVDAVLKLSEFFASLTIAG